MQSTLGDAWNMQRFFFLILPLVYAKTGWRLRVTWVQTRSFIFTQNLIFSNSWWNFLPSFNVATGSKRVDLRWRAIDFTLVNLALRRMWDYCNGCVHLSMSVSMSLHFLFKNVFLCNCLSDQCKTLNKGVTRHGVCRVIMSSVNWYSSHNWLNQNPYLKNLKLHISDLQPNVNEEFNLQCHRSCDLVAILDWK